MEPLGEVTTGMALEGSGLRRTGETGEKGFKALEREGRRCKDRGG